MVERVPLSGRRPWRFALAAPPLVFLAVFFVWPVAAIIGRGLHQHGSWDLHSVYSVLRDPSIRRVAWFTLWESLLSTAMCVLVGVPGAAVFARFTFRGSRVLWSMLLVPFVLPTVVVGVAFLTLIGPSGLTGVRLSGTVWAILIAHVFFNYAVVVRTVGAAWSTLDGRPTEAARTLGAGPVRAFLTTTLPMLRPALLAASSIVFLFSFTSFGIVIILGGVRQRTLEVEIYDQTARFLHLDLAAGLALLQLVGIVVLLVLFGRAQTRRSTQVTPRAQHVNARAIRTATDRVFVGVNLAVMGLLLATPLLVLIVRSLSTGSGWGFDAYRALATARAGTTARIDPVDAIRNSLMFATGATVIAVLLGACASWAIVGLLPRDRRSGAAARLAGRFTDVALMIPLGTSAVTVGFGFLIVFDRPPVDLRASLWLLPIAHAVIALPFVVRLLVPALRAIPADVRGAAASLGASPVQVWWTIELPIVRRSLLVAAGFAFAVALGEFGATAFLVRPDHLTLPIAIYRSLGRVGGDSFSQAMALSVILMGLTAFVIVGIDRIRPPRSAEF